MGLSYSCNCAERKKEVTQRKWVVTQYKWNSGAFTSGCGEYSNYSGLRCLSCGKVWRTKAKYVENMPRMTHKEADQEVRRLRSDRV